MNACGPNSLNPPYKSGGEANRCEIISSQSVVAGCDAPEVLQSVERRLDSPAQLVEAPVEGGTAVSDCTDLE